MQKKNWYHIIRFNLLVVLCAIAVLASAVFVSQRPALAREAAANDARQAYLPSDTNISVVSWGYGRLDILAIGSDGAIWIKSFEGSWFPWGSLGKPGTSSFSAVEAVSWGPNRLDIFGVANQKVWHKYWDGSAWGPAGTWEDLGGGTNQFKLGIQAVAWEPGRLDLFTVQMGSCSSYNSCSDEPILHKWYAGGWGPNQTDWESLGSIYGTIHVVSPAPNRLNIFSTDNYSVQHGPTYTTWHKYWDGSSWLPSITTWQNMNKPSQQSPYAVSMDIGRLDVFVRADDGNIWRKSSPNSGISWTAWQSLGGNGSNSGEPSVESWGSGRLDVFVRGTGGTGIIYHKWLNGSTWGPAGATGIWESLGGNSGFTRAPEAVAWGPVRLDIFERTSSGEVWHKWTNGGAWGPTQETWESLGAPQ